MLEYFSILIIIIIICSVPTHNNRQNNIKLLFSIMLIFLFMALRVDFGGDYRGYLNTFNEISQFNIESNVEFGFYFLNKIMPSFRMLLVVTSFLFCAALFFLFKRYISPKYWAFAFMILFFTKSMLIGNISGIRNGIAVSAFIFGFYFLEQNKKVRYILLLILASYFHTSALFFLPLVFITSKPLSKIKIQLLWLFVIVFALLTTFFPNIINLLSVWITSNVSVFSRYETYLNDEIEYGNRGLSLLLIFFMFYHNITALKEKNPTHKESLLIKLSLFYYIIMLLPGIGLLSRMYFYLAFPQLVGNLYVMSKIRNRQIRWAYIFGMLVLPLMEFYPYAMSLHFKEHILYYHSILFY